MLKIEHLSKNYGNKKAVDDLNLHIFVYAHSCFYIGGRETVRSLPDGITVFCCCHSAGNHCLLGHCRCYAAGGHGWFTDDLVNFCICIDHIMCVGMAGG